MRGLDRKGVGSSGKMTPAESNEKWMHTVSKFRIAVNMEVLTEDRKASNTKAEFQWLKSQLLGATAQT